MSSSKFVVVLRMMTGGWGGAASSTGRCFHDPDRRFPRALRAAATGSHILEAFNRLFITVANACAENMYH